MEHDLKHLEHGLKPVFEALPSFVQHKTINGHEIPKNGYP
jgi:hypothetical protein